MNASRKKGLGRGLSALFGDSTPEEKTKNTNQSTMVAIADLSGILTNQGKVLKRRNWKNWLIL